MNDILLSPVRLHELETLIEHSVERALKAHKADRIEQPEDIMNIRQAAAFLNLRVPTIYTKVSRGELPYMKKNKRLYFSREELVEYLRAGRKPTNAEIEVLAHHNLKK